MVPSMIAISRRIEIVAAKVAAATQKSCRLKCQSWRQLAQSNSDHEISSSRPAMAGIGIHRHEADRQGRWRRVIDVRSQVLAKGDEPARRRRGQAEQIGQRGERDQRRGAAHEAAQCRR